jgi:hypothetical protein
MGTTAYLLCVTVFCELEDYRLELFPKAPTKFKQTALKQDFPRAKRPPGFFQLSSVHGRPYRQSDRRC